MPDLHLAHHRQCGALTALARDLALGLPHATVRKVAKGLNSLLENCANLP